MAPRTTGCDRSVPQTSGAGERVTPPTQQTNTSSLSKGDASKEKQPPKLGTVSASPQIIHSGSASSDQKSARWAKYQDRYHQFLAEADKRRLRRKEFDARNNIWQEERGKTQTRLDAIELEQEQLRQKMEKLEAATDSYNAVNTVRVSAEKDQETKEKWDAFLRMEVDELDI